MEAITRMFSQQQHRQMDCGSQDHSPIGPKPWGRWVSDFRTVQAAQTICTFDHVSYAIPSVVWGSTPQADMISSVKRMRPHTKWNRSY